MYNINPYMTSNYTFNFEEALQKFGKKLGNFQNQISANPTTETSNNANTNDKIIVKNEILSIFYKSKLHPNQFAELLVTSNIYIENEKMGD